MKQSRDISGADTLYSNTMTDNLGGNDILTAGSGNRFVSYALSVSGCNKKYNSDNLFINDTYMKGFQFSRYTKTYKFSDDMAIIAVCRGYDNTAKDEEPRVAAMVMKQLEHIAENKDTEFETLLYNINVAIHNIHITLINENIGAASVIILALHEKRLVVYKAGNCSGILKSGGKTMSLSNNVLNAPLGNGGMTELCDCSHYTLRDDATILLCTDEAAAVLPEDSLAELVRYSEDASTLPNEAYNEIVKNGGNEGVTALAINVLPAKKSTYVNYKTPLMLATIIIAVVLTALLVFAAFPKEESKDTENTTTVSDFVTDKQEKVRAKENAQKWEREKENISDAISKAEEVLNANSELAYDYIDYRQLDDLISETRQIITQIDMEQDIDKGSKMQENNIDGRADDIYQKTQLLQAVADQRAAEQAAAQASQSPSATPSAQTNKASKSKQAAKTQTPVKTAPAKTQHQTPPPAPTYQPVPKGETTSPNTAPKATSAPTTESKPNKTAPPIRGDFD